MKINKNNIKKYTAVGLLTIVLTTGAGIKIEQSAEHLYKTCPLCYVLGMKHQANYINKNWNDKYVAVYSPKDDIPDGYVKRVEGRGLKRDGIFLKYDEGTAYAILYDDDGNIADRIQIVDYDRVDIYHKWFYDFYDGDLDNKQLEPSRTLSLKNKG